MQLHLRSRIVVASGVCAVALGGVLAARAQDPASPKRGGADPATQEARALIAHGLSMAIEGSMLQSLAMQGGRGMGNAAAMAPAGAKAAGPGGVTAPGGAAAPGVTTDFDRGRLDPYGGPPRPGEAGTGTAGSPAGTAGSGIYTYGRDPDGPRTTVAGTTGAGTAGAGTA